MALNASNVTVEQQLAYSGMVSTPTATTVSNSTITLTATSNSAQFLSGTTAGQIFRLPSGTAISAGTIYRFWNASSTSVAIQNNAGTALVSIAAGNILEIILRVAGTTAGTWSWAVSATGGANGGPGITPPIFFARGGAVSTGTYLLTMGFVTSSTVGAVTPGSNYVTKIAVSSSANVTGATVTLQLQQRTALNSFSDITGATVTVTSGNYRNVNVLPTPVAIGPDIELSCYVTSGVIQQPLLFVYLVPQ